MDARDADAPSDLTVNIGGHPGPILGAAQSVAAPKHANPRARQHTKLTGASVVKDACVDKWGRHTGYQYYQDANVCDTDTVVLTS